MGPTNVALVKFFRADSEYRQAKSRYEAAARDVRVQERKLSDLQARLDASNQQLREQQAKSANIELDIKSREARIEKLRQQQQTARNNKEYQSYLIQINTEKVDKGKVEDELLQVMAAVETLQSQTAQLASQLDAEKQKLEEMRAKITDRLAQIQVEIDRLKPVRDEAETGVAPDVLAMYERLAERFDGEALASIEKPNPRVEEYICSACNMELMVDIYNRLHTRDEPTFCPSCRRFLFIPDELQPEQALNTKKKSKKKSKKGEDSSDDGDGSNVEESSQSVA